MSEVKKIDLGVVTPQFRLEGKKLQIKYPEEDWQDLADFSDVATALELRLNDETNAVEVMQSNGEWAVLLDLSKVGGGIKTVQTYRDLPTDAKEGDVCLVLEDGYGEDDWRQLSVNDILVGKCPSQISFANTLDEIMSGCLFDRDILVSGTTQTDVCFLGSDNSKIGISFIHIKAEGQVCTAIYTEVYDNATEIYKIYAITDNPEVCSSLMDFDTTLNLSPNVWNEINSADGETFAITPLEAAPVIDGIESVTEPFETVEETCREANTISPFLKYKKSYNLVNCKFNDTIYSIINGNFASAKSSGIYNYTDGKWHGNDDEIKEYRNIDFGSLYNIPPGKEGEIAKFYPTVKSSDTAYFTQETFSCNIGYSSGSYSAYDIGELCLSDNPSAEAVQALNNKTIVINGARGSSYYDAVITCVDGVLLVLDNNSSRGLAYSSVADKVFDPADFSGILDEDDISEMVSFKFSEAGWYAFYDGVVVKCNVTKSPIKHWLFRGYALSASGSVFLLDGITSAVPSSASTSGKGSSCTIEGLFKKCNSQYAYSWENTEYDIWDYSYAGFAEYKNGEWNIVDSPFAAKKVSEMAHNHENKAILDKIDSTMLENLRNVNNIQTEVDEALANVTDNTEARHTHGNLNYLNTLKATPKQVVGWENASSDVVVNMDLSERGDFDVYFNGVSTDPPYNSLTIDVTEPEQEGYSAPTAYERSVTFETFADKPVYIRVSSFWATDIPEIYPSYKYKVTVTPHRGFSPIQASTYNIYYYSFAAVEKSFGYPNYLRNKKNLKYAKIVDGCCEYAPSYFKFDANKALAENGKYYGFNMPESFYLEQGYKKVIGDGYPVDGDAYTSIEYFETEDSIVRVVHHIFPLAPKLDKAYYQCQANVAMEYLDTSSVVSAISAFEESAFTSLPVLNVSRCKSIENMCNGCSNLTTITKVVFSHMPTSAMTGAFTDCTVLEAITAEGTIKVDCDYTLFNTGEVSVESAVSFLNAFEDNTGEEVQYTVNIGSVYSLLSEEQKAIATNKYILLAGE